MSDEEVYNVEAIRGWRYNSRLRRREYYIKWRDYEEEENSWEPEDNLNCQAILQMFEASLSNKERRYYESASKNLLNGFQRHAEFIDCIGADKPHTSDEDDEEKLERKPFYCLVRFMDSDEAEEVPFKEFYKYQPKAAIEFLEARLLIKE